ALSPLVAAREAGRVEYLRLEAEPDEVLVPRELEGLGYETALHGVLGLQEDAPLGALARRRRRDGRAPSVREDPARVEDRVERTLRARPGDVRGRLHDVRGGRLER